MTKRKAISPKTRFEVFKRDKFVCQYCGDSPPGITLEVDHIKPVSKGGTNIIVNLVTSCWDCNSGKSNRELDDNSVVIKQKKQLDLLQENREQMKMMLEWSDELQDIDNEKNRELVKRINKKMFPRVVTEGFEKRFANITKKHVLPDVLEAIEIASDRYLKFDIDGNATEESTNNFVSKIPGVIHNLNVPPIQQKANYIKGICKNRLSYWDPKKGAILLNNYIKALKDYGYVEQQILENLESQLMPKAKEVKNWTEWKNLIENWIVSINNWDDKSSISEESKENKGMTEWDYVRDSTFCLLINRLSFIDSLEFLKKELKSINMDVMILNLDNLIVAHLKDLMKNYNENFNMRDYKYQSNYRTFTSQFEESLKNTKHRDGIRNLLDGALTELLYNCSVHAKNFDQFNYMGLVFILKTDPETSEVMEKEHNDLYEVAKAYYQDYNKFLKGEVSDIELPLALAQ